MGMEETIKFVNPKTFILFVDKSWEKLMDHLFNCMNIQKQPKYEYIWNRQILKSIQRRKSVFKCTLGDILILD